VIHIRTCDQKNWFRLRANDFGEGVAEGLDPDGSLRLRLEDGQIRRITAGDVFFEGL